MADAPRKLRSSDWFGGAGKNAFMVHGKYDPTFLPALTAQMMDALRRHGAAQ